MHELHRQSAPAVVLRAGRTGVLGQAAGLEMQHLQPSAMVQINGANDARQLHDALAALELTQAPAPRACIAAAQCRLLWNGPGRYLLVSDDQAPGELLASLTSAALRMAGLSCVDVSHANGVLRVQGPAALEVMLKGCALDLERMQAGGCVPTAIGRFDVLLHCVGEEAFDLYVARSLAQSFAHWLLRAGAEFGVQVRA